MCSGQMAPLGRWWGIEGVEQMLEYPGVDVLKQLLVVLLLAEHFDHVVL